MSANSKTKAAAAGPARGAVLRKRSAARMGAVQALYQIAVTDLAADAVVLEFFQHQLQEDFEGLRLDKLDREFFSDLVRGIARETESLDDMLSAVLADGWPVERLELLLKVILRGGAFELGHWPEIGARTIITEYVDLAHAFFDGKEPSMANGVLDSLARSLRPEEFEAEGPAAVTPITG